MLTRLKVSGFKNLVDVDVRFGAFTCIAGVNGVGKSNLFDAIRFLSALAQYPLTEAALMIRDGSGTADIRNLFHRVGDRYVDKMSFEAEMIIPQETINIRGQNIQNIKATNNFVSYSLVLGYKKNDNSRSLETLEILKEELSEISEDNLNQYLLFKYKDKNLINFQFDNECFTYKAYNNFTPNAKIIFVKPILDVYEVDEHGEEIGLSEKTIGRPIDLNTTALYDFSDLFLSSAEPTLYLARKEMISWQLLQLEPSALRRPDEFTAPKRLGTNGANLAATLYYLVEKYSQENLDKVSEAEIEASVYAQVSNRLSELLDDIESVSIDRDDARQLLTLMVKTRDGTVHSARSLSDGTLRFLALIILELDPDSLRLLCLEEPENGIHPERITSILELLQDIAVDFAEPISFDNPLRQVIINTHSPVVVQQVPDDSLLVAELKETVVDGQRFKRACFSYLPDTWRDHENEEDRESKIISKGELLSYLNPVSSQPEQDRVVDRPDLQSMIPGNNSN
jgi:predicted ATPase